MTRIELEFDPEYAALSDRHLTNRSVLEQAAIRADKPRIKVVGAIGSYFARKAYQSASEAYDRTTEQVRSAEMRRMQARSGEFVVRGLTDDPTPAEIPGLSTQDFKDMGEFPVRNLE